jgi:hypothetical protein
MEFNVAQIITVINETIVNLESLPVRTEPEQELLENLTRVLKEYNDKAG